jgi:hypothetical protein
MRDDSSPRRPWRRLLRHCLPRGDVRPVSGLLLEPRLVQLRVPPADGEQLLVRPRSTADPPSTTRTTSAVRAMTTAVRPDRPSRSGPPGWRPRSVTEVGDGLVEKFPAHPTNATERRATDVRVAPDSGSATRCPPTATYRRTRASQQLNSTGSKWRDGPLSWTYPACCDGDIRAGRHQGEDAGRLLAAHRRGGQRPWKLVRQEPRRLR